VSLAADYSVISVCYSLLVIVLCFTGVVMSLQLFNIIFIILKFDSCAP